MPNTLHTVAIWPTITHLAKAGRGYVAVAYCQTGARKLLPLRPGRVLVVDASLHAVRSGKTNATELLKFVRAGIDVHTAERLHAKASTPEGVPPAEVCPRRGSPGAGGRNAASLRCGHRYGSSRWSTKIGMTTPKQQQPRAVPQRSVRCPGTTRCRRSRDPPVVAGSVLMAAPLPSPVSRWRGTGPRERCRRRGRRGCRREGRLRCHARGHARRNTLDHVGSVRAVGC